MNRLFLDYVDKYFCLWVVFLNPNVYLNCLVRQIKCGKYSIAFVVSLTVFTFMKSQIFGWNDEQIIYFTNLKSIAIFSEIALLFVVFLWNDVNFTKHSRILILFYGWKVFMYRKVELGRTFWLLFVSIR